MDDKLITLPDSPSDTVPTKYWETLDDGRVMCTLCPRECKMKDGQRGLCFVRKAQDGAVVMTSYGRSSGFCIDPIEKKPLSHFLPGTPVLSLGTAGCNLACSFCQNWDISKAREMDRIQDLAQPEMIAKAAVETGCRSVAFTYNDPVIFMEYAIDIAQACHEHDIKTVAVTAGYINDEPRKEFYKYMDAANVDLKAFTEDFYWRETKGHLKPVLDTLVYLKEHTDCWFEITTLLIPDENDSNQEIREQCEWMMKNLGPDVPLHFSAFHPDYRMRDKSHTPPETLKRARAIAQDIGLRYVYTGNIHDEEGGTTTCHSCGEKLIVRDWHLIRHWSLTDDGHCSKCGASVAGVFDGPPGDWGRKRVPIRIGSAGIQVAQPASARSKPEKKEDLNRAYQPKTKTNHKIKRPQVAGAFYPENASVLAKTVDRMLQAAPAPQMQPKAIIAPHAGYIYSGEIAARAFNALGNKKSTIKRVVLFGPPHRKAVKGIAVPSYDIFATPLGPVHVDREAIGKLKQLPFVEEDDSPFENEHGLEVHLPFLQRIFENIEIVPALVGATTPEQAAEALHTVWGGDETLILISSDLSHFYDYAKASKLDNAAAAAIESLRPDQLGEEQACGRHAVRGLLVESVRHNLRATTIDLRNSGDTQGKKDSVVGYGAFIFEPADAARIPEAQANVLLDVAKQVVTKGAQTGKPPQIRLTNVPRMLMAWRPSFTTITMNDQLRGCYGSFVANQPLIHDVAKSAFSAAFQDPRFRPMTTAEIANADLGLSVLSVACRFPVEDEADLLKKVRPGVDGLILRDAGRQGLFLPSVWDQLKEPEDFITGLKRKAGLPEDHWSDDIEFFRYTAEKIGPVPIGGGSTPPPQTKSGGLFSGGIFSGGFFGSN